MHMHLSVPPRQWLRHVMLDHATLEPSARIVAYFIADHCDASGSSSPSIETLAAETSLSGRTVKRGMAALIERGWIARERRARDTNVYLLTERRV